jgi:tetratricopeptide (TPR) repeat protein
VLCLAERGEFAEGAARAEEALRVAESVDQPFSIVSASAGLGRLLLRRGDPARAIPILERGLELSRTWNIRLLFPMVASGLGSAYLLAGRVAEALPVLEEALAQHAAMRGRAGQSIRESALAAAYLAAGGLTAATQHATRALTIAGEHGERGNEAYAWLVLGDLAARAEPARLEEAGRAYAEAMARADSLAMRPLAAQCRLAQGMLRRRAGDVTAARELLAAAYGEFAALGMPLWLARAEAERSALG